MQLIIARMLQYKYMRNPRIFFESFDDGGIVLRLEDRILFHLNQLDCEILMRIEQSALLHDIITSNNDIAFTSIKKLMQHNLIAYKTKQSEGIMAKQYIRNSDVVVREEEEEGCLLFNPDTNQVQVLNETATFIWHYSDGSHDLDAVIGAVANEFEGVPLDTIKEDTTDFVSLMVLSGFLGEVL